MHLINGLPWFDLEPYLDLSDLEKQRHLFALAIASNPSHIFTSLVGIQSNLYDQKETELGDFAKMRARLPGEDSEAFSTLGSMARFYTYCKYMYPVTPLGLCMYIRTIRDDNYFKKHKKEACIDTPVSSHFGFLLDWLDGSGVFEEYGRVILFLNEPGTSTPMHRDYPFPVSQKNQFIWLSLGNSKSFFVADDNGTKHHITSRCAIFDNANWHGSEPCCHATWSLRVDGVFSESFLEKTGLSSHFSG